MKTLRLLLLGLVIAACAHAQNAGPDLDFAFSQLKGNGPVPFARALYDTDQENARQVVSQLSPLLAQSGDFFGYEIVSRKFLTKRVERVVVVIYFERFPLYMRIDYYDTPKGRICLPASFTKEASAILPFDLISATGK
jgi:hypothetical protein